MILCTSFSWHNVILHIPIHFSSYFRLGYGRLIRFSGNLHLLRSIFLLKHGFRHHTPFVLNLTLSISPPPASSLAFALGTDGGRVSAGAGSGFRPSHQGYFGFLERFPPSWVVGFPWRVYALPSSFLSCLILVASWVLELR
jgi:hypothetical protein